MRSEDGSYRSFIVKKDDGTEILRDRCVVQDVLNKRWNILGTIKEK